MTDYIENIEVENKEKDKKMKGFKLFKKQIDIIKLQIENDLTDDEITEIFEEDQKLQNIDLRKAKQYMNTGIYFALEERYEEILEDKTNDNDLYE